MAFTPAMRHEELWVGEMAGVDVGGRRVLLVNVDGDVCAYEDRCPHRSLPLSRGMLLGRRLVCRAHEWTYDACTGHGVNPDNVALRRYPVRIAAHHIEVDVDVDFGAEGDADAR
jgi:toluene monooxygenase system ferredoxin subunit